jgi:NADPH:quinone reductase-like Zn-dependent oxidoreductase
LIGGPLLIVSFVFQLFGSQLIQSGGVVPVVGQTYSLAEAPDAMRHLEAGAARGKIAITV